MMKIEYYTNDFPYIIIDDVYTENIFLQIMIELMKKVNL